MTVCTLCPRKCGKARFETEGRGFCAMGETPVLARAALHHWEEPAISGDRGSGAVFFSGCSLGCVFCQNYEISAGRFGKPVPAPKLRDIFLRLAGQGAHNINLVNPTHFVPAILAALTPSLPVPVVYNSGGYESVSTLQSLAGKIDIYLPDLKYGPGEEAAARYSNAPDYFDRATEALFEMYRQTGDCVSGEDGILQKGLVVRHLVLPGHLRNTFAVLDWFAANFADKGVYLSLMSQYVPCGRAKEFPPLDRRVTKREFDAVLRYLSALPITRGWVQERESADASYIPLWNFEGL